NTVALYPAGQALSLQPTSLSRQDRAVLHLATPGGQLGTASTRLIFDNGATVPLLGAGGAAGSTSISIVPFAYADQMSQTPYGFLTYDANGLRPLAFNEYATAFSNAQENVRLISGSVNTGTNTYTVNSIASAGNFINAIGGTGTISVISGALYNV